MTTRRVSVLLLALAVPAVSNANVGPPSSGGHVVAEPVGVTLLAAVALPVGFAIAQLTAAVASRRPVN